MSKGGSSDASVQATLCQPVHGTSFELNSFASMFYLFLSCPPPHCVMGFLHYRVCLGVVTFFAELIFPARTFHNTALLSYEPEPSKTYSSKRSKKTNPKSKPSRSLHLHEILEKRGKTMWRFYFFCSVSFPSQNLPQHSPFELRTRTFQKPTTGGEAKNKPKVKTFQKPTPA